MTARMLTLVLAAGAATALAAPQAQAQRISPMPAGSFVRFCNSPSNGGQKVCDAYITGMADSFALMQKLSQGSSDGSSKNLGQSICVPVTATGESMRGMVVSWIASHKDKLRNKVGEVVYTALHESYPCDSAKSGN